jgi:hypothetical protein
MPDAEIMKLCATSYLEDVRSARDACDSVAEDVQRLEALATLGAVKYRSTPGSPNVDADKVPDIVAELEERRQELLVTIGEYLDLYLRARDMCRPSNVARWVCWLRHVDRLQWREIAARVGYSEEWTRRNLAPMGYEELYFVMPEYYRRVVFPNAQDFDAGE